MLNVQSALDCETDLDEREDYEDATSVTEMMRPSVAQVLVLSMLC
jgi:hypothetical protein